MKKFVTIALSVLMALSCTFVAACAKGGEPSSEVPPTPSTPSTPSTPTEPSTPDDKTDGGKEEPTPPTKTKAEAVAAFNAAVQSIQADKNFTYTELGAEYVAEFDGTKLKVTEGGDSVFYATEAEKNYCYALQDSVWHKDFSETTVGEVFTTLTAVYGDAVWSEYDAEANQLIGNASGGTIRAAVLDGTVTVEVAQKKFTLTKLGTTAVSLPADAIDDTDPSNFIFTTDASGEYVWNVKAIKDVLEPWLKNEMTDASGNHVDNQFGRPVFSDNQNPKKVREIIFVNPTKDKLEFGYILDRSTNKVFAARHIRGWDELVASKTQISKYDFTAFLLSREERNLVSTISNIDFEYTTLDQDYATAHKQEFETLTKNGFERLATIGAQGDNLANEGEIVKDFEGSKILFGFKTPNTTMGLSADMGYTKSFRTYCILQVANGNMEFVDIMYTSKADKATDNVIQNKANSWRIHKIGRRNISPENLALFDEPLMTIGSIA